MLDSGPLSPWGLDAAFLLDLLESAWGFNDAEFEHIMQLQPGWLRAHRNHEVAIDAQVVGRLVRLLRFHDALRVGVAPNSYARAWRRRWTTSSPIGDRSPWQAYQDDGDVALEQIQRYFLAQR